MRTLGVLSSDSGGASGVRTRLRNQMRRLFNTHVRLIYEDAHGEQFVSSAISVPGRVLVERAQARPAFAVGEQNLSGGGVLQRDHQPPGAD